MRVIKRNGKAEDVSFDKITRRIEFLLYGGLKKNIDPVSISKEVIDRIHDGITTTKLDEIAAEICVTKTMTHPDFGVLASRIAINNYQKNTPNSFLEVMDRLRNNKGENGEDWPLIGEDFFKTCRKYAGEIESKLNHARDYLIDYFGFKTLQNAYLMKINGKPVERIQHMWMRVALFLNQNNLSLAIATYELLSQKFYTHATPTLFHAGCVYPQLSSCFLLGVEDSIDGIFSAVKQCAQISKWAGGIGVHISNIRSNGMKIRKTNGESSGIVPMLRVFNMTAEYVNQAGRRKGSFAFYIEPHHPDILDFLELKLNHGAEEKRARSLFYALWISDYFMTCVSENKEWYLLDPDRCPGLGDAYGAEYEKLHNDYVNQGKFERKIKARDVWDAMIRTQTEKGVPYVLFKDAVNNKSNQKHYGTIKSSNLCVAGDTQILTSKGYFPIKSLENQEVMVWNGEQFSETIVKKTGENQDLIRVTVSNGSVLRCTPYHKFWVQDRYGSSIEKEARLLGASEFVTPFSVPDENGDLAVMDNLFITGVCILQEKEDTYCFNEPLKHKGIFNGILTGNCTEIVEFSSPDETAVCNLSSISLPNFVIKPKFSEYFMGDPVGDIKIIIYTVKKCNWCRLTKGWLKENGLKFTERCLHAEEEKQEIKEKFNITTFPQIVKVVENCNVCESHPEGSKTREVLVGGFTELNQIVRPVFNFKKLHEVTSLVTRNLNTVIDLNYYPTRQTKNSNMKHRPIGIGIQGLADVFIMMKMPFESDEARELNKKIFETMYHAALETSIELAREQGRYETFDGSPLSQGKLQFDLWEEFRNPQDEYQFSLTGDWDFEKLREDAKVHGARNSLLLAPMPTASTSQILGNNECFEPYTSNVYTRRVLAGEFLVINKHLVKDLINCNLWSQHIKQKIVYYKGSVQNIKEIPSFLKKIYKTVWEIKQKTIIDLSADRGHYICQSQSMNIHIAEPTKKLIHNVLFYGWKRGLKTGMYYLRSRPAADAQQVSIDPETVRKIKEEDAEEEELCIMCSA